MMNCSDHLKRKAERREQMRRQYRRLILLALLFGLVVGFLTGHLSAQAHNGKPMADTTETPPVIASTTPSSEPRFVSSTPTVIPTVEPEEAEVKEPEREFLGTYRITAYCSCEKCCGEWAKNRPNGIVYGAAGVELKAGVSCASPLPMGTAVEIEGLGTYVVQDRMARWVIEKYGEALIDIYFDNHQEACAFGLKYLDVYKKGDLQ